MKGEVLEASAAEVYDSSNRTGRVNKTPATL